MEEASSVPSAPSRPAIGADAPRPPAPAAPLQEAPKPANGNGPQAPAQRQAPVQGQPARNGAANGVKQGANGKADDEDWWTE